MRLQWKVICKPGPSPDIQSFGTLILDFPAHSLYFCYSSLNEEKWEGKVRKITRTKETSEETTYGVTRKQADKCVNDLADLKKMTPPGSAMRTSRKAIQLKMRIPLSKVEKLRARSTLQVKVKTWIKTEVMHLFAQTALDLRSPIQSGDCPTLEEMGGAVKPSVNKPHSLAHNFQFTFVSYS